MNENKLPEATPDQLLQALEVQLQMQRAKRQRAAGGRTAIRVGGIFLILGAAVAALLILQYAMTELSTRDRSPKSSAQHDSAASRNF